MSLPGDIAVITLTGTYIDMVGNARTGSVTFTPSTPLLVDTSSSTMLGGLTVTVALNASGAFSVVLPCTSGLTPTGWSWNVVETVSGAAPRTYSIALPSTLGSTVDISTLTPLATPGTPSLYLLASQLGTASGPAQLNSSGYLPISEGGTGATTAAGALAALGVPSITTASVYTQRAFAV